LIILFKDAGLPRDANQGATNTQAGRPRKLTTTHGANMADSIPLDPSQDPSHLTTECEYSLPEARQKFRAKEDTEGYSTSDNDECGDYAHSPHLESPKIHRIPHDPSAFNPKGPSTYAPLENWFRTHPKLVKNHAQRSFAQLVSSRFGFGTGICYASYQTIANSSDGQFTWRAVRIHVRDLVGKNLLFRGTHYRGGKRHAVLMFPFYRFLDGVKILLNGELDPRYVSVQDQRRIGREAQAWWDLFVSHGCFDK